MLRRSWVLALLAPLALGGIAQAAQLLPSSGAAAPRAPAGAAAVRAGRSAAPHAAGAAEAGATPLPAAVAGMVPPAAAVDTPIVIRGVVDSTGCTPQAVRPVARRPARVAPRSPRRPAPRRKVTPTRHLVPHRPLEHRRMAVRPRPVRHCAIQTAVFPDVTLRLARSQIRLPYAYVESWPAPAPAGSRLSKEAFLAALAGGGLILLLNDVDHRKSTRTPPGPPGPPVGPVTPEPATMLLVASGLAGIAAARRRRRRRKE